MLKNSEGVFVSEDADNLSYPMEGNDFCFDLEENSFWFNHRNKVINSAFKRVPFNGDFADIGGGNGYQVKYLSGCFPDKKFYLVEPNYAGCRNARKRAIEEVYCMGFNDFPFTEKKIGGVGLFDVIEHIEYDVNFLTELRKYTARPTFLYLTTPAFKGLWSDVDDYSGHFKRYTRSSMANVLEKAGWKVVYISYFFKYLPPLVWTMRCLPNKILGKRNPGDIKKAEQKHHAGSFYEKILFAMHKSEPGKILKRSIKFGSSLLAVAVNE
jgi:hypothetical protein